MFTSDVLTQFSVLTACHAGMMGSYSRTQRAAFNELHKRIQDQSTTLYGTNNKSTRTCGNSS